MDLHTLRVRVAFALDHKEARDLVMATAAWLGVSPRNLDYAIWSYQSGS